MLLTSHFTEVYKGKYNPTQKYALAKQKTNKKTTPRLQEKEYSEVGITVAGLKPT